MYAIFDGNDEQMDYVTSRKKVYVPEYFDLIKNREMTLYYKHMLQNDYNFVVYDFDGPRTENGDVCCLKVTKKC